MSELLNGEVKTFYENGQLESKGFRVDGKLDGLFIEYFENGNIKHRGSYKENVPDSLHEHFYVNGNEKCRGYYYDGIRRGTWQICNEAGQITWHGDFEEHYYQSGYLKAKGSYKDAKRHGPWEFYKDFWRPEEKIPECISKGLKGQIDSKGQYDNGERTGIWNNYYNDGTISSTQSYANDQLNGLEERFDENGQLKSTTNWKNGLKHGLHQEYYPASGVWESWYEIVEEKWGYDDIPDGEYLKWVYSLPVYSMGRYVNGKKEGFWYELDFHEKDDAVFKINNYKNDELIEEAEKKQEKEWDDIDTSEVPDNWDDEGGIPF